MMWVSECMQVSSAFEKLKAALGDVETDLNTKALNGDGVDLRRSQLQARQDEQTSREDEKAKRKAEKEARPPPQPKKRGRPRKVCENEKPTDDPAAGDDSEKPETCEVPESEEHEDGSGEDPPPGSDARGGGSPAPKTSPAAPSRKKRAPKVTLEVEAAEKSQEDANKSRKVEGKESDGGGNEVQGKENDGDGNEVRGKENDGDGNEALRKRVAEDEGGHPEDKVRVRRRRKTMDKPEDAEVEGLGANGGEKKGKAKAKAKAKATPKAKAKAKANDNEEKEADEEKDDPEGTAKKRRKHFEKMVEDVQEVDEALAYELADVIQTNDEAFLEKERVREFFPGNTAKHIKVVFYWDRNAVGIKVAQVPRKWPQICYFQIADVQTIQAAAIMGKRMYDRIVLKGADRAVSLQGVQYKQVLKNTAARAQKILEERASAGGAA